MLAEAFGNGTHHAAGLTPFGSVASSRTSALAALARSRFQWGAVFEEDATLHASVLPSHAALLIQRHRSCRQRSGLVLGRLRFALRKRNHDHCTRLAAVASERRALPGVLHARVRALRQARGLLLRECLLPRRAVRPRLRQAALLHGLGDVAALPARARRVDRRRRLREPVGRRPPRLVRAEPDDDAQGRHHVAPQLSVAQQLARPGPSAVAAALAITVVAATLASTDGGGVGEGSRFFETALKTTTHGYIRMQYLLPEVSRSCAPLHSKKSIIWIGAAPGAGKTTIAKRFQQYGFTTLECEDKWARKNRLESIYNGSLLAANLQSYLIVAACDETYLLRAPDMVVPILILPTFDVYTERWKNRNPKDTQHHNERFNSSVRISMEMNTKVRVLHQYVEESVDETVRRICEIVKQEQRL